MIINEPKPTWECKAGVESAMILDEVFLLQTPSGAFDSEYDVEVAEVTDQHGKTSFFASMFQGRALISKEFYELLSHTPFSTEIKEIDTDGSYTAEGFEIRLAGLHLPPHKAPMGNTH